MSEVGAGGDGAAEITGGGGGEGGGGAAPEWHAGLPDDLKGDATLARYADVPSLAKAHIEAHKVAKSKIVLPGADAGDDAWSAFYAATGRPETADGYGDFGLPALADDADDAAKAARDGLVKQYQEALHPLGLNPRQASALVAADISRIEAAQEAFYKQGQTEVDALKKEMGVEYEPNRAAAQKVFTELFGDDAAALADELDTKVGSARLVKGMMALAKRVGEQDRVDGGGGGLGGGGEANAAEQLKTLQADKGWREKFNSGDAATVEQHSRLLRAAQAQAVAARSKR